ncbi:histidinol dehydrogenase [Roseivirga spongicola]|uniref:Histidinol dehydrogenase n=1 Tax=Roseivirga spongicola TaxID=333140 RepID=A0A150XAZ2_9BACT|nr:MULTISPECIES: histidinol dehydrogenase [Roseivirga]KYG75888.1 histidinol dehydrogenase [Roseivirga spongicola]MBO6662846.1 histidinol dehydrogenase [Roseivirga sp.]MBO6761178.1 histidinol dehydrogenase [Roseivirga sp.]MBO6909776.1 histidinol dehydrogenase [Roseivirga sp.]
MRVFVNPDKATWPDLLKRPTMDLEEIEQRVRPVIEKVKLEGDAALKQFTQEFDGVAIDEFQVSEAEFTEAETLVEADLKTAILTAKSNIEAFHKAQKQEELVVETMPGVKCYRRSVGIEKVGLYIPGGTAPLFSTVLMLAVPAKLAGCQEVVLCSPPNKEGKIHPAILYTAKAVGVTKVFKVGGAQAVAAFTFGTESIPQVNKIFGPGNQYVTAAKQLATRFGLAIDMPAGPSEVAVYANASANPSFVAADLLSQAEHGVDSQVVLVASSEEVVKNVQAEIESQLKALPRAEFAAKALANSVAVVLGEIEAIALLNEYGAEHLILSVDEPWNIANQIINAGSVFLGHLTPESAGDYASGTNHTLPTNGYAKMYSGVSLDSFVKKITYQEITPEGLKVLGPVVEKMAAAEQLEAHKNAVTLRLKSLNNV